MPDKPPVFGRTKPVQRIGGSSTLPDRSAAYKRLCGALIASDPLCRYCFNQRRLTPATLCDHRIALALGGTNDPDNLVPACRQCNSDKATAEQRFLRRGYSIRDIMLDHDLSSWIKLAEKRAE
ncbi:HNH endonuclease signature motif containing protein [uncultured Sphingomonas sp.]|uniref:HNH endonuclease signature motif containing protein n=1 Tax=uncultured Sphingomonas sp. TaxID=158754 RepID=UPI003456CE93